MAEALWYSAPGRAEIRQEALAPPAADEVRVRALFGAVSRGTEALVLAGRVPASEFERMRAPFMAGNFPFPVKYGYATVGRVEGGAEASRGRTVFTLHPHQNFFNIPASAAVVAAGRVCRPQRAVLAANMETALNAVWDAAPGPGRPHRGRRRRRGRLSGRAVCAGGCRARRSRSSTSIRRARNLRASAWRCALRRRKPRRGDCDLVVHASGDRGRARAPRSQLAGEEATVLEMSWYGDDAGDRAAWRRVSQPPAAADIEPGRQDCAVAPAALEPWPPARGRTRLARPIHVLDVLLAPPVAFRGSAGSGCQRF